MKLEIYYVDGRVERGITCLCMEQTPTALFVYKDFRQYCDHLPMQYDGVKSVVAWDENMK